MKVQAAILGSGNIGTDLMVKILRHGKSVGLAAMVGIDKASDGLRRAQNLDVTSIHEGVNGLVNWDGFRDIGVVFDATSAPAHVENARILQAMAPHIRLVDMTPAALGPFCVPVVNLDSHLDASNVNMVTCGGQATIPIVAAVSRVTKVHYAEIVASISSNSAGPGTRANIDEFTETTSRALELVGGASKGKAIIILNPAEPPLMMRDTVYCFSDHADLLRLERSIVEMVDEVRSYVPGYRLKQRVQFDELTASEAKGIPGAQGRGGVKTSVFLEVEGAAHYLPAYAGNLDIMTSAALATAERICDRILRRTQHAHA